MRALFKLFHFALFMSLTSSLCAAVYVVSPAGRDENPGTAEKPWRTVGKAAQTLQAGDTVQIRSGVYKEQVKPAHSGTKAAPIRYTAYLGEKPVIEGKGVKLSEWTGLFFIGNKSYIEVSGLTVQDAGPFEGDSGIMLEKSDHITLKGNRTYNTQSSGIGVWRSHNVLVDGNEVELACNDGSQECISIAQTDGFEVMNNEVHHGGPGHHGAEGIDAKDGSTHGTIHGNRVHHLNRLGIYVDAWDKPTHDIEVFQNVVHDNQADGMAVASENGGMLERVNLHDNVIYRNKTNGFAFAGWGEPVPHHPMRAIEFHHNTLTQNGTGRWGGGVHFENPEAQGLTVRDNLIAENKSFQIVVEKKPVSMKVRHNFIQGFRGLEDTEIRGEAFREGDPLFKNAKEGDFGLQEGSPAKGFGTR